MKWPGFLLRLADGDLLRLADGNLLRDRVCRRLWTSILTSSLGNQVMIEAHAKNALASADAKVAGPALAGALIKVFGAPVALPVNAVLLLASALILRGLASTKGATCGGRTSGARRCWGWLGKHAGWRASLRFAGVVSMLPVLAAWRLPLIRGLKALPAPEHDSDWVGAEAGPGALPK